MSELELGVTMEPFKISQQFFSQKLQYLYRRMSYLYNFVGEKKTIS